MKKPRAKKANAQAREAVKPLIAVQLAGSLLEVIAEYIAEGKVNAPLRKIVEEAERRSSAAVWRKQLFDTIGA